MYTKENGDIILNVCTFEMLVETVVLMSREG